MFDVKVENLRFSYDKELILDKINMEIEAGDFVCILGQSGCGKSTFLRLAAGLEKPDSGNIFIDGSPIDGPSLSRGVVFQDYSLFPWFTTGKNITLSLSQKYKDESKAALKERALYFIKEVGLEESVFYKYPHELSGGMRQRCAICRSFALDPPVLLMDEPFGALDAITRARLQNLVLELWQKDKEKRKTIFFVTHDVDEAILLSTKIFVFGSSPSNVIYTYAFEDKKGFTRENIFENESIIELRNKLIHILNKDIEKRINEN